MYIPDLTERYPEGFRTFDEPDYGYEPTYEELVASGEIQEPNIFHIGNQYRQVGLYGGVTIYEVKEIDRDNNRILLAEMWFDVDGNGTRPAQWHKLVTDENGNEKALDWVSEEFGKIWIWA